jgi:hypothetical protein
LWQLPEELKLLLVDFKPEKDLGSYYDSKEQHLWAWQSWIMPDIYAEGQSLADEMGKLRVRNTDFFLLNMKDDISIILARLKRLLEERLMLIVRNGTT